MNIKILDSWLREHLSTPAKPKDIAEKMSLTSVSIERIEEFGDDFVYDIEVTTNRPELMSVVGIAQEAAAVLKQFGTRATFTPPVLKKPHVPSEIVPMTIENDPRLVRRICAVVMEVNMKQSPKVVQERLEAAGIRSLNNIVDVTNYVMRVVGHPAHVFDYDRIEGHMLKIRESKKGEAIVTLDQKTHVLQGGDSVAVDASGKIVDLLGVMGLENSVVTNQTKRILYFLDNNEPMHIRKTSMGLDIRTEAAQLNEKDLDPELMYDAFLLGIQLYKEIADGRVVSELIDIYPQKEEPKHVNVTLEKINEVIGVSITEKQAQTILQDLGFTISVKNGSLDVTIPSIRAHDMSIEEDVIEEIARVYGYHKIPSLLPPFGNLAPKPYASEFFWENKVKNALKYWGFVEAYTYSMVSEDMYEGPAHDAVSIANPLTTDWVYMRRTLIPNLLRVVEDNKTRDDLKLFELANVYEKQLNDLPKESLHLALVLKKPNASFFEMKGIIEQLAFDIGITELVFKPVSKAGGETQVLIGKDLAGQMEILDTDLINAELEFGVLLKHATTKKVYVPPGKYPPIVEDLAFIVDQEVLTGEMIYVIKKQSPLIKDVTLLDKYENTRTFHIVYQHKEKNLTDKDVAQIRIHIIDTLKKQYNAKVK